MERMFGTVVRGVRAPIIREGDALRLNMAAFPLRISYDAGESSGAMEAGEDTTLLQGLVNLVLSIAGIQYMGLAGVYVGTVVSGGMANLLQPVIVYRDCFGRSAWTYFVDAVKYISVIVGVALLMVPVKHFLLAQVNVLTFIGMGAVVTVVYNMAFCLFFRRTEEFGYLWALVKGKLPGRGVGR